MKHNDVVTSIHITNDTQHRLIRITHHSNRTAYTFQSPPEHTVLNPTKHPKMSAQPNGTNNMENPSLIGGHAQYVKGAAEVHALRLSFTISKLLTPITTP